MADLLFRHGGYRKLKSFQVARLIYDVTVWFVEAHVDRFSRTRDQMVQAARSGVQNIAEGSQASATSRKMEIKLTQVARASLEELKLDYEDFLRQRDLPLLKPRHPVLMRFKKRRPRTLEEFREWIAGELGRGMDGQGQSWTNTDRHGKTKTGTDEQGLLRKSGNRKSRSLSVGDSPCKSLCPECLAANAALSLLNLANWLLDRQVKSLADAFENRGGFTERMYRKRRGKQRDGY